MLWSRFTDNFATVWESIKIRLYPRCCFCYPFLLNVNTMWKVIPKSGKLRTVCLLCCQTVSITSFFFFLKISNGNRIYRTLSSTRNERLPLHIYSWSFLFTFWTNTQMTQETKKSLVCQLLPSYWITTRQLYKSQQNLTRLICQSLHSGIHASSNNLACTHWRNRKLYLTCSQLVEVTPLENFLHIHHYLARHYSQCRCLVRVFSQLAWHWAFD